MNDALQQRADAAEAIIRDAGKLALHYFHSLDSLITESKGLQDRVSEADREVEKLIRTGLLEQFPQDGFLGEESGIAGSLDDNEYIWVIDPIDGTDCFVSGIPVWSISIALVRNGEIQAGLVANPNADELFVAVRGHGASYNGEPIKVNPAQSVRDGVMGIGFSHRVPPAGPLASVEALLKAGGMFQRNGSAALTLAYVAAGRYIGFFEAHINAWDVLAGILLVSEAGGWSNHFLSNHGLTKGNAIVAGAPGIEAELKQICAPILNQ